MHYNDQAKAAHAEKMVLAAYNIQEKAPANIEKLII
jgi:hypothetical protein